MKQLLFTKGPQGPIGATLGTAMNNFCSSSKSTHYITWLFSFWIWRRRCLKFAWFCPLGPSPWAPMGATHTIWTTLNPPTPKDDSCHFCLIFNNAFSKRRWNSYFLQRAHRGPLGPPWELPMNNFCSSSNKVSTNYITWLFSFWIWRRRCLKFAWFWPFGALSPGPPWGPHILFEQLWIPYP